MLPKFRLIVMLNQFLKLIPSKLDWYFSNIQIKFGSAGKEFIRKGSDNSKYVG